MLQLQQASAGRGAMRTPMALNAPNVRGIRPVAPVRTRTPRTARQGARIVQTAATTAYDRDLSSAPRLLQHKTEAFWFYRFLSIVYDHIVNPGHWSPDMRDDALEPAMLDNPNYKVVDVGGGTGFTTLGVVKHINPANVTLIDQSPHQLEKARKKPALQQVKIMEGDAEDLPFATDSFDRYVSAGSIEYWPEPQRGIKEAYRVIKPGGLACLIGPVHPTNPISSFFADAWMLFPTEAEYLQWFKAAGFSDVEIKRIGPKWYRGARQHGLIMGCSVTGRKTNAGDSPLEMGPKSETSTPRPSNPISFLVRMILGLSAGFYYFLLPVVFYIRHLISPKSWRFDKP